MLNFELSQVIIQIIAFLIMLWLMKKFGWRPLLDTLEKRKNKIQAEFNLIDAKNEEVNQLRLSYEKSLIEIDKDARNKIQEAIAEGRKIGLEIEKDALAKNKSILEQTKQEIENEIAKAKKQLKIDIVNLVVKTTEKILQEKLDPETQSKLVTKFVEEVKL